MSDPMPNIRAKKKADPKTNADLARMLLMDDRLQIDAPSFLRDLMDEIGGQKELARIFARTLRDPDIGSQAKTKMLDTIQRLIIMCTQHDLVKDVEPGDMSDDDLHRVGMQLMGKVLNANGQAPGAGTSG